MEAGQSSVTGGQPPGQELFHGMDGTREVPVRQTLTKRLAYRLLDAVNRAVTKDPALMALHSSVDVEDGVLAVAEEAAARGVRPVVLLEDPARARLVERLSGGRVRALPKRSVRGLWTFLTAKHVVTTSNVYGNRRPPASQVVVSLWHGEPPSKVTARFEGNSGLHGTYAPVCSTVGRAYRSVEFDIPPLRVPIVGAPRNDRMLRADAGQLRRALLGDDAHRTTFLWMPSYRVGRYAHGLRLDAGNRPGLPFSSEDLRRLDDWLAAQGARLVVKVHPRDAADFGGGFRAVRVLLPGDLEASGTTLYPALAAFDALITDMSSVWLDHLLLDRPMVFAFPDLHEYRDGRGLNLEPYEEWVPGPFALTMDELLAALADIVDGGDPMAAERSRALRRFHRYHDDRSSARLLDGLGLT